LEIRYVRSGARELVISVDTEATLQTVTDVVRALGASEMSLDPKAVVGDLQAAGSREARKSQPTEKGSAKKAAPAKKVTTKKAAPAKKVTTKKAAPTKKVTTKKAAPTKKVTTKKAAPAKNVTAKKVTTKKSTRSPHKSESSRAYARPVSDALTRGGDDLGPMIRKRK
jgi:outer membrane biosynthesis protein TonB